MKSEGNGQLTGEYGKTTIVEDMHTRKKAMAQDVVNGGPGSGFIVSTAILPFVLHFRRSRNVKYNMLTCSP